MVLQEEVAATPGSSVGIPLTLFTSVKSGNTIGECRVTILCQPPTGKAVTVGEAIGNLTGGEHGINIRAPLIFPFHGAGLYWFDINVNGRVMTSTPLRVEFPTPKVSGPQPRKPTKPAKG